MEFLPDEEEEAILPPLASQYAYDINDAYPIPAEVEGGMDYRNEAEMELIPDTPSLTPPYEYTGADPVPAEVEEGMDHTNDADMEFIPDTPSPTSPYGYAGADPVPAEVEGGMDHTPDDPGSPSQEYEHYNELEPVDPHAHLRTGGLEVRFYSSQQVSTMSGSAWWRDVRRVWRDAPRDGPAALTTERVAVCLQSPTMRMHEQPLCFAVLQYRVNETSRNGTVYVIAAGSWVGQLERTFHVSSGLEERASDFLFACIEAETTNGTYDTDRVTFTDVCLRSTRYTSHYAERHGYVKMGNVYIKHCRDARV